MQHPRQPSGVLDNATDIALLASLTIVAIVTTGTWLTGQLAALFFRGDWPPVSVGQALAAAWRLPGHVHDPRLAWPASARPQLPGPFGFLVAGLVASLAVMVIMLALGSWALRHRQQRGFASRAQVKAALSERAVVKRGPVVRPSLRRKPR
jgi:type IV secretion system protein VirD4